MTPITGQQAIEALNIISTRIAYRMLAQLLSLTHEELSPFISSLALREYEQLSKEQILKLLQEVKVAKQEFIREFNEAA